CRRLRPRHFWCRNKRNDRELDNPSVRSADLLETNLDADLAQESRSPTQPTRECPRGIRPGLGFRQALIYQLPKRAQKVRGSSRALCLRRHRGAPSGGDRVGLNDAINCLVAIAAIRCPEGSRWPNGRLAGGGPTREIRHARQPIEMDVR